MNSMFRVGVGVRDSLFWDCMVENHMEKNMENETDTLNPKPKQRLTGTEVRRRGSLMVVKGTRRVWVPFYTRGPSIMCSGCRETQEKGA